MVYNYRVYTEYRDFPVFSIQGWLLEASQKNLTRLAIDDRLSRDFQILGID